MAGFAAPTLAAQGRGDAAPAPDAVGAAVTTHQTGLLPGDVLRLRIWREPDLSGEFPVDERGVATLPRLGEVRVTGLTPDSLRAQLVHDYARYLNNPSVEVTPLRRVAVIGAVRQPGLYPVDPTMRVSEVLALAGGAAADGKQDRVELRRGGERVEADLALVSTVGQSLIRSGDQLYVPQRGWLARNPWLVSGVLGAVTAVTVALIR
jgi:polysaccharide export outer membrane protein